MTSPPPAGFALSVVSLAAGVKLLALRGELDYGDASRVREALDGQVAAEGTRGLIVDLSDLDFIDSGGIQALVLAARAADARAIAFVIVSPTTNVARIFEIVRLGDVVAVEETVEAATLRIDGG